MLVVWTLVGALLLTLLVRYLQRKKYKLPPGPGGLPFFGNVFQLDEEKPHHTITKWAEEYGDVFKMKAFGRTTVVLNSYKTIYEGLVTKANQFAGRVPSTRIETALSHCPNIADATFSPQWLFRKKATMQTLKMYGDNLQNLEMISMDLIGDMLKELEEVASTKGPKDISDIYIRCVAGILSSLLYGEKSDPETIRTIRQCVDESFVLLQPAGLDLVLDIFPWLRHFPNSLYRKLVKVAAKAKGVMTEKINQRKAEHVPGHPICFNDGLLDFQRKCEETQAEMKLSDAEIYGINFDVFLAATYTTSATISALLALLVNKPGIQQRMAHEIKTVLGERPPRITDRKSLHYVEAAILEVLRYTSMIPLNVAHYTMEDTTINGYDIPKDTEVLFNLWMLHHNPEYWDEPWEFKPKRYLDKDGHLVPVDHINRKRLLAFGASRRVCAGETLARNRLFLMMTSLLQHFEFLPAEPDEIPRHDPRDYKASFGIEPHNYRLRMVPRL